MSRPLGLALAARVVERRGESAGDKECSENVVAGESAPFGALLEFQPKKEVNPPAGDLGLFDCPRLSGRYASSVKSSAAPSTLSFRSGSLESDVYEGMFGMVGDRAWTILLPATRS
jgi:hypothetical protein